MKKAILILFAACLAAASGCTREPAVTPDSGGKVLVLSAHAPASKVSVAPSGKVCWSEGDEIALYNAAGQIFKAVLNSGAGTSLGSFVCDNFSGEAGEVAVYPYSLAGAAPGEISIPWSSERSDGTPALMASRFTASPEGTPSELFFKHIAPVVELNFRDIPAYARALVVRANGRRLNGNFRFDTALQGPLLSEELPSSLMISFPYCAGCGKELSFRFPLPPGEYSDISVGFLDGDEAYIEGLENLPFGKSSLSFEAGDYLAMPLLDVRSLCKRSEGIRKVEGICWASGNLIAEASGSTSEGFQQGWRIASEQYEFLGWDSVGSGTGLTFQQSDDAFDRFNWGGLAGDARSADSGYMLPQEAKFKISGRIFSADKGSGEAIDASELEGDGRFAVPAGGPLAGGSTLHGDVAFWASRGQYRLPSSDEIVTLRAGASETAASGQAGYVTVGGNTIYGILLRSTPSWEKSELNTAAVEFSEADLESGLFLPKAGRGRYISGSSTSTISYVNTQGYYRSGTFSGLDLDKYPSSDHAATVLGFRAANSCDYGYTVHLNSDAAWGVGHVQKCLPVRPVLVAEESLPEPDPLPRPDANTLPAWSPGYLDIHAINSGRGECTLVIMPDGTSMMIDAGEYHTSSATAVDQKPYPGVRPFKVYTSYSKYFLAPTGHDYLDYFLVTHYHIDHMGQHRTAYGTSGNGYCRSGVMAVYDDLPIKKLVDRLGPAGNPDTEDYSAEVYEDFYKFATYRKETDGMEWYALNMNASGNYKKQFVPKYDSDCGLTVYNLGANGKYWNGTGFSTKGSKLTENGVCATVLISYGDFDYYSGGDCACQTGMMQLIVEGLGKKVEAMKAGHHMYYNTLDASTATRLQPKVTVGQIFDSDKPGDPAFSLHRLWGDVFITNIHSGRLDNSASIKGGTPVESLATKVRDYGGHFVIRVAPGGREFMVYKLRDTDFSYSVQASYGPYTCH